MRLQLALNVPNLAEAVDFYGKIFNAKPHKLRRGYANFALDSPPLKLVLFENPAATERLNHLGVEVFEQAELDATERRFVESEILDTVESESTCCHAIQNKIWAQEPHGLKWEWYRITDDDPPASASESQSGCCAATADGEATVCCA